MALMHLNYVSSYVMGNTDVNIILPDRVKNYDEKYKVIWLLHGTFGDYSDWVRFTNVERYAQEHQFVVVMPSALNSMYVDWSTFSMGHNVYSMFLKELMPMVQGWLPVSKKREDNFIAGLSMGGRGACMFAFNNPQLFGACYSMSAVPYDIDKLDPESPFYPRVLNLINNFGGMEGYLDSILNLKKTLLAAEDLPKLYFACGTKDPIAYEDYVKFKAFAKENGIAADFLTLEGYGHEWDLWDICIKDAMDKFSQL